MNKKDMIIALIEHYSGGNKTKFAKLLGITPQGISTWLKREYFDIELINRFVCKIKFNAISKDVYKEIVANTYTTMIADVKSRIRGITMPDELDDATLDDVVENSYNEKLGARPAYNYIRHYIEENAI